MDFLLPSDPQEGVAAESAAGMIAALMRHRIERYLASRDDLSMYQSLRNMSQFVSDDYGNRFLVELIQNAHDAHDPSRTDGEIAIVLDASDATHGCLYVANRGSGFARKNLEAITSIALSSKPVNLGIGNKGIGFRSVLQVCNWPEIYSASAEASGQFDGYCFRFATLDDFRDYLGPDRYDIAEEMHHTMPCWHVPVPAHPSDRVEQFARMGFSTVVRLPLKSRDAFATASSQIDELIGLSTPIHVFLERVERISVRSGRSAPTILNRLVEQSWSFNPLGFRVDSPIRIFKLRLGESKFVLADWEIDENVFRPVLARSVAKGEIPESWKDWEGRARISIAVPLETSLDQGRLYCFLPLGPEGVAPFAGYLNANFYTKMDRRSVDPGICLNDHFLRMGAWLSCQLINLMVSINWSESPGAVVSLLCWTGEYLVDLKRAMGEGGQGILRRPFLPVQTRGGGLEWGSPEESYTWTAAPDTCMSLDRVSGLGGGRILPESLTDGQRTALDMLYRRLRGRDFSPPPTLVAEWVEKVAEEMHRDGASPELWGAFYDEVAEAMEACPELLFGKRFLLSVSGELIHSEAPVAAALGRSRRAADVYFAPVLSVDSDVDDEASKESLPLESFPATLRSGFAMLSREVPWLKEDGGHRSGRKFLVGGGLAREYDTRDVLRTLASVTRSADESGTRLQALEWAFRLWSSGRSLSDKETRAAGFHVPAVSGWIEADAAMFGSGWDVANGSKLAHFLRAGAGKSADCAQVLDHLLPAFTAWPISHGEIVGWSRFLFATGVRDALRPMRCDASIADPVGKPADLVAAVAAAYPGFSDSLQSLWREQLTRDIAKMFSTVRYRAELRFWRFPGQDQLQSFPSDLRRDYAVQIAIAMRALSEEHLTFRTARPTTGAVVTDSHRLSTPLRAFLAFGEWVPVLKPGSTPRFVKPAEAWLFKAEDKRPPRFLEFVVHPVVAALDESAAEWLQRHAGLSLFNDGRHAQRALHYLSDAATARITEFRDVRRFQELFQRVWSSARHVSQPPPARCVPVLVNGEVRAIAGDSAAAPDAWFDDGQDSLRRQLLDEVGEPVFGFLRGDDPAAWDWVSASAPGRFRLLSEQRADVFVDGVRFDEVYPARPLTEVIGSWIVDFLVLVAEYKGSAFVQVTQKTLGRIRRQAMSLSVVTGQEIRIAHGDDQLPLPSSLAGVLTFSRTAGSVLIAEVHRGTDLTLPLLAGAAGQLAIALGAKELSHGLEAALLRLSTMVRVESGDVPDDAMLATSLGIDTAAIERTRKLAIGDLQSVLSLSVPLAACFGLPEIAARLQALADQEDPAEQNLREVFEALARALDLSFAQFEERMAHLADLHDLKSAFSIPIAEMNTAIASLGGRFQQISNEVVHREAWTRHLRMRQPTLAEKLRSRMAGIFDRRGRLNAYVTAREGVYRIGPKDSWFVEYDELPESVMDAHIDWWVQEHVPEDSASSPLPTPLSDVRATNGTALRKFVATFAPILIAHFRSVGSAVDPRVREVWKTAENAGETCESHARGSGWLDFRFLKDTDIAHWLELESMWPAGREPSPALSDWGLSEDSLIASEEQARAKKEAEARGRIEIDFGGRKMSALKDGYVDLVAAVIAQVEHAEALRHVHSRDASLEQVGGTPGGGGAKGNTGGSPPKPIDTAMSEEQKRAIGLVGELWAREWIRRSHQLDAVDESIWVSRYRDSVLNTSGGSDFLGYDFIVPLKSRTYYYEVKASTGDPLRFELGPTEIGAAQQYRADRDHRYRILYIAHAGNPARMTVTRLPNPFSIAAADKFRLVGKGSVIYEFRSR